MIRMALILSFLGVAAQARSPIAEVICEPPPALHERLQRQYEAHRSATGIRDPEQIMEVWTGPTGNWTLIVTYANGTSCIVAMGENWTPQREG